MIVASVFKKPPRPKIVRPKEEDEVKVKKEASERARRSAVRRSGGAANQFADQATFGSARAGRAGLKSSFG